MIRHNRLCLSLYVVLASSTFASAASQEQLRVTVLSAESHQVNISPETSRDCDLANYSGYCRGTRTQSVENILTVESSDGKSFRIMCSVDTRWSKCLMLPIGAKLDARLEKHGMTVFFVDDGKPKKQFYEFVAQKKETNLAAAVTNSQTVLSSDSASASTAGAPSGARDVVKCSFSSVPQGAEITLDGRYFGNTPSVVGVTPGMHLVILLAPGFAPWRKNLTVSSGSEVTVSTTLEKSR